MGIGHMLAKGTFSLIGFPTNGTLMDYGIVSVRLLRLYFEG